MYNGKIALPRNRDSPSAEKEGEHGILARIHVSLELCKCLNLLVENLESFQVNFCHFFKTVSSWIFLF